MTRSALVELIFSKRSYLCIGLDPDIDKLPKHLLDFEDPVFEFNRSIIEATADYCVAYKPNLAFYEALGTKGWESLRKTMEVIPPGIFTIADAKRGDIGNTSRLYAKTFFEQFDFDAVTVAPYMGEDSVSPFLHFKDKWVIILALTSNQGAFDFQTLRLTDGSALFQQVLEKSASWGSENQIMYVVGATKPQQLASIREQLPQHFFLVPGVGAQGGDLQQVSKAGFNHECGLLVNSSRGIIYASSERDFAQAAAKEALKLQTRMSELLTDIATDTTITE
jgi:orotidine-5'-phosphate decarboxylase